MWPPQVFNMPNLTIPAIADAFKVQNFTACDASDSFLDGCPAMDFIQDDIRAALEADPDVDEVRIEIVWDPVWTKDRIRAEARERMRELGIVV